MNIKMTTTTEDEIIPPNLAVITTEEVMNKSVPIQLVIRDNEGDWQFLPHIKDIEAVKPIVVAIHRIITNDPTIVETLKLKRGSKAWRESIDKTWIVYDL
jgi:hypothetical protein